MDAVTHTIIATALLFCSYFVGTKTGFRRGVVDAFSTIGHSLNVQHVLVEEDEEGEVDIYVLDQRGIKRKLKF